MFTVTITKKTIGLAYEEPVKEVEQKIYEQTVEEIDVKKVIRAVNENTQLHPAFIEE